MSCRIDQCVVLMESSSTQEKDVSNIMSVRAQIHPVRESEVKVRSVYLISQRLARKVADDELHEDEDD